MTKDEDEEEWRARAWLSRLGGAPSMPAGVLMLGTRTGLSFFNVMQL